MCCVFYFAICLSLSVQLIVFLCPILQFSNSPVSLWRSLCMMLITAQVLWLLYSRSPHLKGKPLVLRAISYYHTVLHLCLVCVWVTEHETSILDIISFLLNWQCILFNECWPCVVLCAILSILLCVSLYILSAHGVPTCIVVICATMSHSRRMQDCQGDR